MQSSEKSVVKLWLFPSVLYCSRVCRPHLTQHVEQYLLSWCKDSRSFRGPFAIPANIPSPAVLDEFCTTVEVRFQKVTSQRHLDRVTNWKERMRNELRQSRRKVLQWFRSEPFCSMSLMSRPNGSLTGNLEEIDEIVQTA